MIRTHLQKGDGIGHRSWLRSVVKTVQQGLANWDKPLDIDGKFGSGTKRATREFQTSAGIAASGEFDPATWSEIDAFLPDSATTSPLPLFRGDLEWVHQQEGHSGKPYWPGGNSGITLDPGVDLGHVSEELVRTFYEPILSAKQMRALEPVFGIKGEDARNALRNATIVKTIRISDNQGSALMHHTAMPYWNGIVRRFSALKRKDTPPSVQTSMLSLAYNRGVFNPHLDSLATPLAKRQWKQAAGIIGSMQQGHKLSGIRLRRRQEKAIIRAELAFLGSG